MFTYETSVSVCDLESPRSARAPRIRMALASNEMDGSPMMQAGNKICRDLSLDW